MLKLLVIAADSVEPSIIYKHKEKFPNLSKMMNIGASLDYSAYVQKGYDGSYSSTQNWASIYTGLTPKEHGIKANCVKERKRKPCMKDFDGLNPFWQILNKNGLSVGLWNADCCTEPKEIYGYVISTLYNGVSSPSDVRSCKRELQIYEKDGDIIKRILSSPPPDFIYPKTLKQQGYKFEELKVDPQKAKEVVLKYHYQEGIELFERDIKYWFDAISEAQRLKPVDVQFFYTGIPDLVAHFCMYCDDNPTLIQLYTILDKYIGRFIEAMNPENTVFLSDHGQQNFSKLIKCSNSDIEREAFSARDEVIWLDNGYIAFEGNNGALYFTTHALYGTFIAAGKDIKKSKLYDMRTVDIYSNILELLNIDIPNDRNGLVQDIFAKEIVNKDKLYSKNCYKKSTAILQTHAINIMDIIINEIYLENRFRSITLVGEQKYKEIFQNNPRVKQFISFDDFKYSEYDEVFCSFFNKENGEIFHVEI